MRHRAAALVAAGGLFAILFTVLAGVALACPPPTITSACSDDANIHNWVVTLAYNESNYTIGWADNAWFHHKNIVTMHGGANNLATPSSVNTIYIRWEALPSSKSSATWTGGACTSPPPSDPPSPSPSPSDSPSPSPSPSPSDSPSPSPSPSPSDSPSPSPSPSISESPSPSPSISESPSDSQTPFHTFQGDTASPTTGDTATPFSSFQGETSPPTGTEGGPAGGQTPLFAVLISGLFGGLGLMAAQYQRAGIRR